MRSIYIFLVTIFALISVSSCKITRPIVNPAEVTHDTIFHERLAYDSIFVHDSIYQETFINGDTVIKYKYIDHTEYRDRFMHDSIYIDRTDTIHTVVNKEVNIITRWQSFRMTLGDLVIMAAVLLLIVWSIRRFL